ncbi:hypothetical protein KA047_02675 [Candidatus Saccharibacteria bacterium]|jgi:hypothetical protein|nr:hypothetical protein [Candidatus Saccharibacteria bacterium]
MTPAELPPEQLFQKLDELRDVIDEYYVRQSRPIATLRDCVGDLLDVLEVSYDTGEPIPQSNFVDPTERTIRDLTEELSDLYMRRDEVKQRIRQNGTERGDRYYLRKLGHEIATVKAELHGLTNPQFDFRI